MPLACSGLSLHWFVLLGPRSVDHGQGLLCLIAAVEPECPGPGALVLWLRASDHGPLVLAL